MAFRMFHLLYPSKALRPEQSPQQRRRREALRGAHRRLAEALDQLHAGVPLNWGQVEDDEQLAVLAGLYEVTLQCREQVPTALPADLRQAVLDDVSARFPEYKPPQVERPRSLAGFSERVPVLTQVEEDVPPLVSKAPQWVAASVAAGLVVMLVFFVLGSVLNAARPVLTFRWIEVRANGRLLNNVQRPPDRATPPSCQRGQSTRFFVTLPTRSELDRYSSFQIRLLPSSLTVPGQPVSSTYVLNLMQVSVSPCVSSVPDPSDPGAIVRLTYLSAQQLNGNYSRLSTLMVYHSRQLPVVVDVSNGVWKEVVEGSAHGIYWRGQPYRDFDGYLWPGDTSLLAVERGDAVTVFVGDAGQGVAEGVLMQILRLQEQAVGPRF